MVKALGRQLKMWRESAGLRQAEFGAQIGYGADMVAAVEGGRRIPKPEYLEAADRVLGAGGRIEAMQRDLEEARYPKKVRDLKKLEAEAVELCVYSNHTIHALLQTEEYTRALFGMRRPLHPEEVIERNVAGRMARQEILDRSKHVPVFSFVQEEVTLSRPLGGRMVKRQQLERLLEVGQFRNVEIQVMPTDREDHAGLAGGFRLFKLHGGKTFGYSEGQHITRLITEHREVQSLEMQYGIIRAQALTPQESLAFIEKLLGET
ncbi:helix-turn-helix transcriptional regulator [Streptomyces ferralitis]|uniref:Helix-turn-helix transcriptional regulator n=2 Tax=Streptantibioticus ferralitis TaxID=236510 RepID=A0ABT5Z6P7_9ACTN|nr:helix-turn-helix transcriptional regulator [Streptantibioticus ferralitis]MDF2259508.1 helix-turn-helix transcriptional regulator [Streptantibioticus ferralitis]